MDLSELLERVTRTLEELTISLRDVAGVVKVEGENLDRAYIEHWARAMGLEEIWAAVLEA